MIIPLLIRSFILLVGQFPVFWIIDGYRPWIRFSWQELHHILNDVYQKNTIYQLDVFYKVALHLWGKECRTIVYNYIMLKWGLHGAAGLQHYFMHLNSYLI